METPQKILLGKGSYGTVIKILRSDRFMARKRLPRVKHEGIDHSSVRECTCLNTFRHPFIVQPEGFEISGHGTIDIFLPLAKTDLHYWIKEKSIATRFLHLTNLAFRMISALEHIHQIGIIHRDIKPSNILVNDDDLFYLSDFGSSRKELTITPVSDTPHLSPDLNGVNITEEKLTHNISESPNMYLDVLDHFTEPPLTKNMITYAYRPPELSSDTYTTSADIYSLGCTLIHYLVGGYPDTPKRIKNTNSDEEYEVPSPDLWAQYFTTFITKTKTFPRFFKSILLSMIQADPQDRPTASQLLTHRVFSKQEKMKVSSRRPSPILSVMDPKMKQIIVFQSQFILRFCHIFHINAMIYKQTVAGLTRFISSQKNYPVLSQMNLNHICLACLRLVCKFYTEQYVPAENLCQYYSRYYDLLVPDDLIKMETYVFLSWGFSIY